MKRSWHTYFMKMAELAAERSTCLRRQVGAVAVKDNHILATGYNGSPTGQIHCQETGCLRETLQVPSGEKHELCRAVHAEQNVICQAAAHGASLIGATLYCTHQPCSICAKLIVNVGISKVVFKDGYPDQMTKEILTNKLKKFEVSNE